MTVLKNVGAVVVGLFVGSLANMAMILVSSFVLWPMPPGTDFQDPVAMQAYVASVPLLCLLWVVVAHLLQAGLGGWIAARLGASVPLILALIVGVLTLLGGVMNLINLAAPAWMWIEVPLYVVVSGAAGWLEVQRRSR